MTPFTPAGDRARWRILYDLLVSRQPDDVVPYDELAEALDLHPVDDRHAIQMAMRRAAKEYEVLDKRAVEAIPNTGYRIVEAEEHLRLAKGQQKRSSKALARGQSKVVNVDLSNVEPEVRRAFDVVAQAFAMQMDFNRRTDVRQKRLEQAVNSITERHDRSEAEIEELRQRLERIEKGREGS